MGLNEYNELFTSADFNVDMILAARQSWGKGDRFNFLAVPRKRHGLLLLTDYPAVFELPDGSMQQANAGSLMLLPRGAHYAISFQLSPGETAHPMLINFRLTAADGSEMQPDCDVQCLCQDDGTLFPQFTAATQFYKSAATAMLKSAVYALLGSLFPVVEEDECCISYINRHYTEQFSVPQMAKRCALSQTAYRKRFRQLTGLSPVRYINRLKIEKACQMLCSGDATPKAVGEFLNFYNLPYFYKVFKEYTGLTPNQYRNLAGNESQ